MGHRDYIGPFEETVLLAVHRLQSNAYGVTIRQTVEEATQKTTSIGAIYTTLDRLEQKGFVSSRLGDPTPERGGRAKKYFTIEGEGVRALNDVQEMRARLSGGQWGRLEPAGGGA